MSPAKRRTVGILGGMGPEATAAFLNLIVRNTRARRDQEHVPVVVCSLPQVPDRTEAILHGGPSPLPLLRRGLRTLRRAGADFAVMPCLSAHHFYATLAARSPIPLIDLVEETAAEVRKRQPRVRKVGLIATSGTVASRVFPRVFEPAGIEVLVPDARAQRRVMEAIYGPAGVKAGASPAPPRRVLRTVASALVRRGAQAIVAGCTEVPLVLRPRDVAVPLVDPMRIGARACIRRAGARLRPEL
ncbi:MAG TPA: amino acid racemase [Terriglobales bacterium]|nr:amino acid racemase [Terriglobales bacterium]